MHMNNKLITYILMVIAITLITFSVNAQVKVSSGSNSDSESNFELTRSISFENDSKSREISIDIQPGTKRFDVNIKSRVLQGGLTLEIYDENNKKRGFFKIRRQIDSEFDSEVTTGNFNKSITDPSPGEWKVMIIPAKATGEVFIKTYSIL